MLRHLKDDYQVILPGINVENAIFTHPLPQQKHQKLRAPYLHFASR